MSYLTKEAAIRAYQAGVLEEALDQHCPQPFQLRHLLDQFGVISLNSHRKRLVSSVRRAIEKELGIRQTPDEEVVDDDGA